MRKAVDDGFTTFITGMSRGFDIWAGQAVLNLRAQNHAIRLVAVSPYRGFEERWPEPWKDRYHFILEWADAVRFVSPGYSKDAFQKRNEWMVCRSSRVIALYRGIPGGTQNTIRFAEQHSVQVVNLIPDEIAFQ